MMDSPSALMAHFVLNLGLLAAVVSSGLAVLFVVFRKMRRYDEWRKNRVAFFSIWGLSCLFGSTWTLAFFTSETSETVLFLFCIINSLQGEFQGVFSFPRLERKGSTDKAIVYVAEISCADKIRAECSCCVFTPHAAAGQILQTQSQ